MSYQDVRGFYEEPPNEEDLKRADRARALRTHRLHECQDENCYPCGGGLTLCTVCGGAEATLPYECPGVRMTADQELDVSGARRDFIAGEWREVRQA